MDTYQKVQPSRAIEIIDTIDFDQLMTLSKKAINAADAFKYATKACELAQDTLREDQIAIAQLRLTEVLIENGAYNEALIKNELALTYFQKTNKKIEETTCWQYMSTIYQSLHNFEKQLEYCRKTLALTKELNKPIEELRILNSIGDIYIDLNRYDEALEVFENNLKNSNADTSIIGLSLQNIAKVHFQNKDMVLAKLKFEETLAFAEENNLQEIMKTCYHYLGTILYHNKDIKRSVTYFEKTLSLYKGLECSEEDNLVTIEYLLKSHLELEKVDKAATYFNEYQTLQQSIIKRTSHKADTNNQFRIAINGIERPCKLLEQKNIKLLEANKKIETQSHTLQLKSLQLEEVNQELKDFAYIVSHDIKEPIRTVTSFSKLLKMEMGAEASPNAVEYLDFIQTASKRMTDFVGDILSYSTAEKTDRPAEMVDCNVVLNQIELNVNKRLEESKGQLIYSELPSIKAHRSLILQIFQNLISNALKFSKPGVPPIVRVSGKETETEIIFKVEDNGIGIKKEHQDKVFNLFQRLNNRSDYEGSGIGLSTVVKVLRKYNGKIELESEYGEGTCFTIRFPKSFEM